MIEYRVEILRGINHWETISTHRLFPAALDNYVLLEDQGHEVRITGVMHKEWIVL
jgi:hypothetical protein